jgi:hypothetical protein
MSCHLCELLMFTEAVSYSTNRTSITYSFPLNGPISLLSSLSQTTGTLRVSLDDQLSEDTASIQVIARGIASPKVKDVAACLSTKSGRYTNFSLKVSGIHTKRFNLLNEITLNSKKVPQPNLRPFLSLCNSHREGLPILDW